MSSALRRSRSSPQATAARSYARLEVHVPIGMLTSIGWIGCDLKCARLFTAIPSYDGRASAPVELHAQPREREGAERQAEVSQGDVVVARVEQQVRDDGPEPQRHDVGADPGLERDDQARE